MSKVLENQAQQGRVQIDPPRETRIWDPLVRVFHWSLATAFVVVYATGDEWESLHVYAGYLILGLLLFRIVWGLAGSRHARFSDFVTSPRVAWRYLQDTLKRKAKRYLGHNPAGGAMIVLMLASLLLATITGLGLYAIEDQAGPLAGWLGHLGESWEEPFEEVHEFFANFSLLLVLIHIGGVIVESLLHRENLIRSMFTGRKRL